MRDKKHLIPLMIGIVLLTLCFLAFQKFSDNETAYMQKLCEKQLETYAQQNVSSIYSKLDNERENVSLASATFANTEDILADNALYSLRIILSNTAFKRMFISDAAGNCRSNTGSYHHVSQQDFYRRAMCGESTIVLSKSNKDSDQYIIVTAPIISKGRVVGAVHGELELFPLLKIMNRNSFAGKGYAAMINTDGNYVISSNNSNEMNVSGENLFVWMQRAKQLDGQTPNSIKASMQHSGFGKFTLALGEEKRVFYYLPIGINNWYLLQQVSNEYVESLFAATQKSAFVLTIEICICILLAVAAIMYYINRGRKEREATVARFMALSNNIPGGVFEVEIGNDFLVQYANEGFFSLVGYTEEEYMQGDICGHGLKIVCNCNQEKFLAKLNQQIAQEQKVFAEIQICKKNREIRWVSMSGTVINWKHGNAVVQAILIDITLQKAQTDLIVENAKRDKMTQLYDKVSATDIISGILSRIDCHKINALMIVDIDNFKRVNDTYGHAVGDRAIIMVTEAMKKYFRNTDIIGRIGGDEFIICMCDIPDKTFVEMKINGFLEKVRNLSLFDVPGELSCSIGCAVLPSDCQVTFEKSFEAADQCLYRVKKNGKGRVEVCQLNLEPSTEEEH